MCIGTYIINTQVIDGYYIVLSLMSNEVPFERMYDLVMVM